MVKDCKALQDELYERKYKLYLFEQRNRTLEHLNTMSGLVEDNSGLVLRVSLGLECSESNRNQISVADLKVESKEIAKTIVQLVRDRYAQETKELKEETEHQLRTLAQSLLEVEI